MQPLTSEWSLEQVLVEGNIVDVDQEPLVQAYVVIRSLVADIELEGFSATRVSMHYAQRENIGELLPFLEIEALQYFLWAEFGLECFYPQVVSH